MQGKIEKMFLIDLCNLAEWKSEKNFAKSFKKSLTNYQRKNHSKNFVRHSSAVLNVDGGPLSCQLIKITFFTVSRY